MSSKLILKLYNRRRGQSHAPGLCLPFYLPPAKNLAYGKQSFEDESAHNYYDEAVAWGSSYPTGGEDPAITDSDDDNDEEEEETEESGSNDDTSGMEPHQDLSDSSAQCT